MSDLISRKALLDALNKEQIPYNADVNYFIVQAPSVDAEPVRHGRWIHTQTDCEEWGGTFHRFTCSACGWSMGDNPYGWGIFCPNCGAKMDGEK